MKAPAAEKVACTVCGSAYSGGQSICFRTPESVLTHWQAGYDRKEALAKKLADVLLKMFENFDSHIHGGRSVHPEFAVAKEAREALRAAGRLP